VSERTDSQMVEKLYFTMPTTQTPCTAEELCLEYTQAKPMRVVKRYKLASYIEGRKG